MKNAQKDKTLALEILDFSDIQQLEESIAPIMIMTAPVGGKCTGGSGSGCYCVQP